MARYIAFSIKVINLVAIIFGGLIDYLVLITTLVTTREKRIIL